MNKSEKLEEDRLIVSMLVRYFLGGLIGKRGFVVIGELYGVF